MATVADMLSLLDDKLLHYANAFDLPGQADAQARKIRALNAGKEKVWQLLVAASRPERASWFAKSTSVTVLLGTNNVALPTDFHDMLFVESASVKMIGSHWAKDSWRSQRAETANIAVADLPAMYYVVAGDTPAVLQVSRRPAANLSVTIHYTSTLPEWTASGDNIDRLPSPYRNAACNYAARLLTAAMQDPETAKDWASLWNDDVQSIGGASGARSTGQNLLQDGMDVQS